MAQLEVFITTDDQINLADYSTIEGIAAVEERLYLPGAVTLSGTAVSMILIGRPDLTTGQINVMSAREGQLDAARGTEVVLERNCASHYGLDHCAAQLGIRRRWASAHSGPDRSNADLRAGRRDRHGQDSDHSPWRELASG
jgi:hypothetical protein